jgi:UDP-2-acetamido-2,6-beta-L-arabino-hexul-4-ose reductase
MRVLITGANGFLGKNLRLWLRERTDIEVLSFTRENSLEELPGLIAQVNFVFHLAGINRPQDPNEFFSGNSDLTRALSSSVAQVLKDNDRKIPIVFASSIQAARENPYGESKRAAEDALFVLSRNHKTPVSILRLPNVFGKWCKPNYNSAVATFCHNISRGLPIRINESSAPLTLVYVDNVMSAFLSFLDNGYVPKDDNGFSKVEPEYQTTVGEVAKLIQGFKEKRDNLMIDRVGDSLVRALYATYISYLDPADFTYALPKHGDERGVFCEMLKTRDSGQFSFFTAHPGATRGGHYHHSKTEKFLVIHGEACFKFRHMDTGETHKIVTSGTNTQVVDTVPGWTHDITNIGQTELIVMLWANEIFDREKPDTYAMPVVTDLK